VPGYVRVDDVTDLLKVLIEEGDLAIRCGRYLVGRGGTCFNAGDVTPEQFASEVTVEYALIVLRTRPLFFIQRQSVRALPERISLLVAEPFSTRFFAFVACRSSATGRHRPSP
jgi:hypothetical protein